MEGKLLLSLFLSFFKVGATTFGGGYAMLPVIKREVVEDRKWLSDEEFIDILSVAQSSPGPVAVNSAVFVGYKVEGLAGALCALLGAVLPSFVVILTIALFFTRFTAEPLVLAAFAGIRPAIAALIVAAVVKIGKPVFKQRNSAILTAAFLLLATVFAVHPIVIILLGAGLGMLSFRSIASERQDEKS